MVAKFRQPVSGLTHFAGAVLALIGQGVLLSVSGNRPFEKLSLVVYSASLFLMFLTSSVYHLTRSTPDVIERLRRLDHAAIYLLIAGTYTPFCINAFQGFWKWGLLAIVWLLAVIGIGANIWLIRAPRWMTAGAYVVMGWLVVLAYQEMMASLSPATIRWLFAGGMAYTLGALIYITRRMDFIPNVFGFHEVWHLFVMAGAAAHFLAVYQMLLGIRG